METFLLVLYITAAIGLLIYGINCYVMIVMFLRKHRKQRVHWHRIMARGRYELLRRDDAPVITTQIPIYNEANVVENVLRSVAAMEYPRNKHEIQILDDSTDETTGIVDRVAGELRKTGADIKVIRRENRVGYKAGALREGLAVAKGEFVAIFDADFMPQKDYLLRMVPLLIASPDMGFAQARWGHLNSSHSLLTRSQTLGIDGHFMIEQCARAYNKLFLNINGTAGLWRKQAILDAGNWEDDTLTEDMDLSYRCQLAGWGATYVPDVVVPAELPESYSAFKNQQFRWAKGSIQTALKIMPRVMRSDKNLFTKLQAFLHMTHYAIHPLMALMALLALPVLLTVEVALPLYVNILIGAGILLAMLGPSSMYIVSQIAQGRERLRCLFFLPPLMCVGVGIAFSNTRAVFESLSGVSSAFIRTPKRGSRIKNYKTRISWLPLLEVTMGLYCAFSLFVYMSADKYLVGPFLLIYSLGFIFVGLNSMRESFSRA